MIEAYVRQIDVLPPEFAEMTNMNGVTHRLATSKARLTITLEVTDIDKNSAVRKLVEAFHSEQNYAIKVGIVTDGVREVACKIKPKPQSDSPATAEEAW